MLLMDLFVYLLLKACFLQFAHTNSRHAYRCSISVYLKLRQENVPHKIRYSSLNIVVDEEVVEPFARVLGVQTRFAYLMRDSVNMYVEFVKVLN